MRQSSRLCVIFLFIVASSAASLSPAAFDSKPFSHRKIALTFDDGPKPGPTYRLSSVLKKNGVAATFFVVGQMAARYPEVVRLIAQDGHEIANHTWSHSELKGMSPDRFMDELEGTRCLIEELTGHDSYLFRTPGSTENFIRKCFVVPAQYTLILWDIHSLDQEGIPAAEIAERVESMAKDGDIVLMHNGIQATVEALEVAIPRLRAKGFEFLTVSEILKYRRKFVATALDKAVIRG